MRVSYGDIYYEALEDLLKEEKDKLESLIGKEILDKIYTRDLIGIGFHTETGYIEICNTIDDAEISFNNSKPMLETLVRSKRIKENALKLIDSGGIPSENYKHNVYCCTNCNEIYSRFYFCIIYEGKVYEPEYHCSKCKRILNKVRIISEKDNLKIFDEHKEYSWKCPICGCNKLEIDNDSGILMWD